uniref:MBT domain-containing protein 1-like isoform X1 n=2 Tax=Myxine glutinosa TaxID=7769 RepID=UPI00358DE263
MGQLKTRQSSLRPKHARVVSSEYLRLMIHLPPSLTPTSMSFRDAPCVTTMKDSLEITSDHDDELWRDPATSNQPAESKAGTTISFEKNVVSETAVCEMCGILGSHMAFYSHSKRFCSASCSRGFSSTYAPKCNKLMSFPRTSQVKKPIKQTKLNFNKMDARQNFLGPVKSFRTQNSEWSCKVFNWPTYLKNNICVTPSVNTLPHALMAKHWKDVKIGIKVEVLNRDCQQSDRTYWFATVIKIFGYYVLLRYEGMENDSLDFWNNICILSVHPVSWSNVQRWILAPPASIQHTQSDWNSFMVQRLSGSYTLPSVFHTKVLESLRWRGRVGMRLEVVDKASISQVRVASILDVVGGRICLLYENEFGSTNEKLRLPQKIFNRRQTWCHCWSPLIHPLGWARRVGHPIVNYTSLDYLNAVPAEDFYQPKQQHHEDGWKVGMKLEAVHPLNMSDICVATVSKVLLDGYIMIRTDDNYIEGNTLFCYHTSSACLLPAGWCQINKIPLIPPRERVSRDGDEFSWPKYLEKTGTVAVPAHLFDQSKPCNNIHPCMKIEVADQMEPSLICVATILANPGRLLRIAFDGWESSYDQWIPVDSPEIYPPGWCEMTGYPLQRPQQPEQQHPGKLKEPCGPDIILAETST